MSDLDVFKIWGGDWTRSDVHKADSHFIWPIIMPAIGPRRDTRSAKAIISIWNIHVGSNNRALTGSFLSSSCNVIWSSSSPVSSDHFVSNLAGDPASRNYTTDVSNMVQQSHATLHPLQGIASEISSEEQRRRRRDGEGMVRTEHLPLMAIILNYHLVMAVHLSLCTRAAAQQQLLQLLQQQRNANGNRSSRPSATMPGIRNGRSKSSRWKRWTTETKVSFLTTKGSTADGSHKTSAVHSLFVCCIPFLNF